MLPIYDGVTIKNFAPVTIEGLEEVQLLFDESAPDNDRPIIGGEYISLPKECRKDFLLDAVYLYLTKQVKTERLPIPKTRAEWLILNIYNCLVSNAHHTPDIRYIKTTEEHLLYNWHLLLEHKDTIKIPEKCLQTDTDYWLYEINDNLAGDSWAPPKEVEKYTSWAVLRYALISELL